MIKSELIEEIAARMTHLTEKQVADGVNRILDLMTDALVSNKRIEIRGFGSFSLHQKVVTSEKYSPHFRPGKELRERVDSSREKYPLPNDKD